MLYEITEYLDDFGRSPYARWLNKLRDRQALLKVIAQVDKMEGGNFGDICPVGDGVSETRIHYGPGYRIYHVIDKCDGGGTNKLLLLCAGDKSSPCRDIQLAKQYWLHHKQRRYLIREPEAGYVPAFDVRDQSIEGIKSDSVGENEMGKSQTKINPRNVRETHNRYLRDPEFAKDYLNEFLKTGDLAEVLLAIKNIAQAQEGGVSAVARETGLSRPSLYKALAEEGNPKFSTILNVIDAVGLRLSTELAS